MSQLEEDCLHLTPHALQKIVEQLKIANQLKALELKYRVFGSRFITVEMIDAALTSNA